MKLFQTAISQCPPQLPQIDHQTPPVGSEIVGPIQTNNTFSNMLLDDQTWPSWPLPYSVWVTKDKDADLGVAVNHTDRQQVVFGPEPNLDPAQYYFNPPRIKLFCFSGQGWKDIEVRITESGKMNATVTVKGNGRLTMPLVYGMGFVSAVYENETPVIHSAVGVQDFQNVGRVGQTSKYRVVLFNQVTWSLYSEVELSLRDPNHIVAKAPTKRALIQLARGDDKAYDETSGKYAVRAELAGEVEKKGTYTIRHVMEGTSKSGKGLIWALPHHQATSSQQSTSLALDSPTKGTMKAYQADELVMEVELPSVSFEPSTTVPGFEYQLKNYTPEIQELIRKAAKEEAQNIGANCDLDSMYFGGKQLDKYAYIAYVCHFILRDLELTREILPQVKQAIEKYASNQQQHPLAYDKTWKGIISNTQPGEDFGNSCYNDHHFHYGYHIHAIALVGSIDPRWLEENDLRIRKYADFLIRDYANPIQDEFFPQFRNFDWYHGHSFAHGLFPSGDGKNEESSLEDYHAYYAVQLYGRLTQNRELEHTASLILGIMRTSLNMYMMYADDNKEQPAQFKKNKVSGILFENKIDYATFFGRGTIGNEFIHGIHMIPITPISSYMRGPKFVKEEWDQKLAGIVEKIPDGWRGLLKLNQGLFDPKSAWKWFSRDDWQAHLIDGGMSRTWSLAYLAGIGGAK